MGFEYLKSQRTNLLPTQQQITGCTEQHPRKGTERDAGDNSDNNNLLHTVTKSFSLPKRQHICNNVNFELSDRTYRYEHQCIRVPLKDG
jgi:hypothetical protein